MYAANNASVVSETGLVDYNSIEGLSTGNGGGAGSGSFITIDLIRDWEEIPAS
jgi:hypothetical protein